MLRYDYNDDNKKYLVSGIAVAVSVYALCGGRAFGVLLGIVMAVGIAFGKECYDHIRKRLAWDWADCIFETLNELLG